jgi:tetratricopeptide (TPR) repeat protein
MHFQPFRLLGALPLLLLLACKDPEAVAAEERARAAQRALSEGRTLLGNGQAEAAVTHLKEAVSLLPKELTPLLLLAEAHRQSGNSAAAILTLKEAVNLNPQEAPSIKRQLVDLYQRDGKVPLAITTLLELKQAGQLGDIDILTLARLQAQQGQHTAAFTTLEAIQRKRPDDADAKVVEAEILWRKGEEVAAAKLMDRLIEEQPGLAPARLLRARYFLESGYAQAAESDLSAVGAEDARKPEVVTLRARMLMALKRYAEAEPLLVEAVSSNPHNPELLLALAETQLQLSRPHEAQMVVEQVLQSQPGSTRALFLRASVLEKQMDLGRAKAAYRAVLAADAAYAPALSRLWRLQRDTEEKLEVMNTLERLMELGKASIEEKVMLAELYLETKSREEEALELAEEALAAEPDNRRYQELHKALKALQAPKQPSGPIIIRGGSGKRRR